VNTSRKRRRRDADIRSAAAAAHSSISETTLTAVVVAVLYRRPAVVLSTDIQVLSGCGSGTLERPNGTLCVLEHKANADDAEVVKCGRIYDCYTPVLLPETIHQTRSDAALVTRTGGSDITFLLGQSGGRLRVRRYPVQATALSSLSFDPKGG